MKIACVLSACRRALSLENANGIRHVRAYYLADGLRRLGAEIAFCTPPAMLTQDCDHCLCFVGRSLASPEEIWKLRKGTRGLICSVKDTWKQRMLEDVTFYSLDPPPSATPPEECVLIGIAADSGVFQPRQEKQITVLVDHPHYGAGVDVDHSQKILDSIRGTAFRVQRLGCYDDDGGYVGPVSHLSAAAAHNSAHVFCTTHPESLGLSVVEAAMAGNLIVTRRGHIKDSLLRTLHHYIWDDRPDWGKIEAMINPQRCRTTALRYDRWAEMATIAMDALTR